MCEGHLISLRYRYISLKADEGFHLDIGEGDRGRDKDLANVILKLLFIRGDEKRKGGIGPALFEDRECGGDEEEEEMVMTAPSDRRWD